MKKIIFVVSLLVLVGAGCSNSADNVSAPKLDISSEISGRWEFAGPSVWSGVSHVSVELSVDENDNVEGTFLSILNRPGAPAVYIDEGTFSGEVLYPKNKPVLQISWQGDRSDNGSAVLNYDDEKRTLDWIGTTQADDGLYTIPQDMGLVKADVAILPEQEWALHALAEQRAMNVMNRSDIEASTDRLWTSFARILIEPRGSITDPAYVYMKREEDGWKYVAGPGIETEEAFLETGLPITLFYAND